LPSKGHFQDDIQIFFVTLKSPDFKHFDRKSSNSFIWASIKLSGESFSFRIARGVFTAYIFSSPLFRAQTIFFF
jgi:hypothetical protein